MSATLFSRIRLSHLMAILSLSLWFSSLFMVGFTFFENIEPYSGLKILASGWSGLFNLNFPWYANPLYLLAMVVLLCGGKQTIQLFSVALIIALDMVRFDRVYFNEAGGGWDVYGYGSGAFVWLAALIVGLSAALQRRVETSSDSQSSISRHSAVMVMVFSLLTLASIVMYLRIADLKSASSAEREYLEGALFKLGDTCPYDITPALSPKINVAQLHVDSEELPPPYFTADRESFFRKLPDVIYKGYKYSTVSDGGLVEVTKSNYLTSGLSLHFERKYSHKANVGGGDFVLSVLLKDIESERHLFKQSWVDSPRYRSLCPLKSDGFILRNNPLTMLQDSFLIQRLSETDKARPVSVQAVMVDGVRTQVGGGHGPEKRRLVGCNDSVFEFKGNEHFIKRYGFSDLPKYGNLTVIGGRVVFPLGLNGAWNFSCAQGNIYYFDRYSQGNALVLMERRVSDLKLLRSFNVLFPSVEEARDSVWISYLSGVDVSENGLKFQVVNYMKGTYKNYVVSTQ